MRLIFTLFALLNIIYAKTNIVVSILPQQTFVEKIGGEKVTVTTMVKPGSDPHTYEPKPSQMRAVSKAQIYFPINLEFENTWLKKFKAQNENMKFVDMTKNIALIPMQEHSHHEDKHEHEEELPFEWAGAFDLKKGEYSWSFSKVDGKYADPAMKMLIVKADKQSDDLIETYEHRAKDIFEKNKTSIAKDNDFLKTSNSFYKLNFNENKNKSTFKIKIEKAGKYLFFTEHLPSEFEGSEHFFKDLKNNDIEAFDSHPKESEDEHHHHHHGEKDPHVWTSPSNVKIMAKNIYNTLIKHDPKNKDYYKTNYIKFLDEINATDKKIRSLFLDLPANSKFMVFHPSWGYFAKEYSLVQVAIEVEGKEPKPKMLQKIIKEAKEEKIKAIFTQLEFSDKSARTIASELNIKVLKETPLASNWSQNLIELAKAIANNK